MSTEPLIKDGRIIAEANTELTPEKSAILGVSLGTFLMRSLDRYGTVITGRDSRNDCRMLKRSFIAGLMSAGFDVMDFHEAPAPMVHFAVRRFGTDCGAMFSSSHYSPGNVSIKLYDSAGIEFSVEKLREVARIYENLEKVSRASPSEIGKISVIEQARNVYANALKKFVDSKMIKEKKLSVVVDCALGPSSLMLPALLSELNCDVIALNSYTPGIHQTKYFLPNIKSFQILSQTVTTYGADLGVAYDSDADRAIFADEKGNLIEPDDILILFALSEIARYGGKKKTGNLTTSSTVVVSETTTKRIDEILEKQGIRVYRASLLPGEISNSIRKNRAMLGGTDQGGFIWPSFSHEYDGMLATINMLEILAKTQKPLSKLVKKVSQPVISGTIIKGKPKTWEEAISELMKQYPKRCIDTLLGVKILDETGKGWVRIKPALKEKAYILTAESKDKETAQKILDIMIEKIKCSLCVCENDQQ